MDGQTTDGRTDGRTDVRWTDDGRTGSYFGIVFRDRISGSYFGSVALKNMPNVKLQMSNVKERQRRIPTTAYNIRTFVHSTDGRRTDGQTDGRTNGRTDGRMDGRTDGQTDGIVFRDRISGS